MDKLKDLLTARNLTEQNYKPLTEEERLQKEIDIYNDSVGDLDDGIHCETCKNRGYIAFNRDGYKSLKECACMVQRRNKTILRKSGLAELVSKCTFDSYIAKDQWQKIIKEKALQFVNNFIGKWFYRGGQVGSGKTHICTAICGELMKNGIEVRYMLWQNETTKLKRDKYDDGEAYDNRMWKLENVPVLYIDDFFKSGGEPTRADIDIAQEILDYRYFNHKTTIISSEYDIDGLIDIEESIGSRIIEMAENYILIVEKDQSKNHRLK